MKFLDDNHKDFFEEKKLEVIEKKQKIDSYYSSLIYILGLCETTRDHFKEIFDLDKEEINIDSIQKVWQTNTSVKVTRMAFSLWNGCNYDSEEDIDRRKVSPLYNVSELFCCSYAPYFFEGISIRFPEYTNYNQKENETVEAMLPNYQIKEEIEEKSPKDTVGLYIRVEGISNDDVDGSFQRQEFMLNQYCKENNIKNRIKYIDIGKSAFDYDRKGLNQMIKDAKEGKINKIIITDIGRLYRNPIDVYNFFEKDFLKYVDFISLDNFDCNITRSCNRHINEDLEIL